MSLARTQLPVLFVEDDPSLRETFATMLQRLGIEIEITDSFASARTYLEQHEIAGLITDNQLGDGKGSDLAELALQRNPNIWVGIVSGSDPELPQSLEDRVTILYKPFSLDELRTFLKDFPRRARPA